MTPPELPKSVVDPPIQTEDLVALVQMDPRLASRLKKVLYDVSYQLYLIRSGLTDLEQGSQRDLAEMTQAMTAMIDAQRDRLENATNDLTIAQSARYGFAAMLRDPLVWRKMVLGGLALVGASLAGDAFNLLGMLF